MEDPEIVMTWDQISEAIERYRQAVLKNIKVVDQNEKIIASAELARQMHARINPLPIIDTSIEA